MNRPVEDMRPAPRKPRIAPPKSDDRSAELKSVPSTQLGAQQIAHLRTAVLQGLRKKKAE
jgi:hypothetical protein